MPQRQGCATPALQLHLRAGNTAKSAKLHTGGCRRCWGGASMQSSWRRWVFATAAACAFFGNPAHSAIIAIRHGGLQLWQERVRQ